MGLFDLLRKKPAAGGKPPPSKAEWTERLLSFAAERHAARPTPPLEGLDSLAQAQYRAEGGFIQAWMRQYGPRMLAERKMLLEGLDGYSPEPLAVVHGDVPLVSAVLYLTDSTAIRGEGQLLVLLDEDYTAFIRENPEPREFDFHISSWSRFIPASAELLESARRKGLSVSPSLTYFNHVNGTLWGPQHGLEVENLWSWDGANLELVEEALSHKRF